MKLKQKKFLLKSMLVILAAIFTMNLCTLDKSYAESYIGAPSGLTATITPNSIEISWFAVDNAVSYDIEIDGAVYTVNAYSSWKEYFKNTGLSPCTTHVYRVRAVNEYGYCSYWSYQMVATTTPMKPSYLDTVAYLNSIDLFWDAAIGAQLYEIEADGKVCYCGSDLSLKYNGLSPNTEHYFRVRSYSYVGGYSSWSKYIYATTLLMSENDIQTIIEPRKVVLNWKKIKNAALYNVTDKKGKVIASTSNNWYEVTGLYPDSTYKFRIGVDGKSNLSEVVTIITASETITYSVDVPIVSYTYLSSKEIEFSWISDSVATAYEIERNGVIIGQVSNLYANSKIMFVDNTFDTKVTNSYKIRGIQNSFYVGGWSNAITILGIPDLKACSLNDTSNRLTWNSIYGATSYDISIDGTIVNTLGTSLDDVGIAENANASYRIRAVNSNGSGAWSDEVKMLAAPADFKVYRNWLLQDVLTWKAVPGAKKYEIWYEGKYYDTTKDTSYSTYMCLPFTTDSYEVRAINDNVNGKFTKKVTN